MDKQQIKCRDCGRRFKKQAHLDQHSTAKHPVNFGMRFEEAPDHDPNLEPDWEGECEVCGAAPIVPQTGMCGPCTFGEAETIGGNW